MTMRFELAFALKNWLLITLLGPQTNFGKMASMLNENIS